MATVQKLIDSALRTIGVIAAGEQAKPSEHQDAKAYADQLLDSWANEGLIAWARTSENFTTIAQRIITIGAGGDLDTERPITISSISIVDGSGSEHVCRVASLSQMRSLFGKASEVSYPSLYYYEPEFPLGLIEFSGIPEAGNTLKVVSNKQLVTLPGLTEQISMPPGYERAMRLGLAIELAPEYGKTIDQVIAATYSKAIQNLKRTNSKSRIGKMRVDDALLSNSSYDINQGPI